MTASSAPHLDDKGPDDTGPDIVELEGAECSRTAGNSLSRSLDELRMGSRTQDARREWSQ
jgi:hypothetical protein